MSGEAMHPQAYAMDAWQYRIGVEYESRVATDALEAADVQGRVIEMAGESLVSHRRTLAVHIYQLFLPSINVSYIPILSSVAAWSESPTHISHPTPSPSFCPA
jgi:hypothetical protein